MNLKAHHPGFKIWAGAQADIDRVLSIWKGCFIAYGGPYLFGAKPVVADAMYAPVCTRFATYDVALDSDCADYRDLMLHHPFMQEWKSASRSEEDELEELDVEF
jgi:glutathione S-transferase